MIVPLSLPVKYHPNFTHNVVLNANMINLNEKMEYQYTEMLDIKDSDRVYYEKKPLTNAEMQSLGSQGSIVRNGYYEGDGVFCSFNCMVSFLKEHSNQFKYKQSHSLLHQLYFDIFGKYPVDKIQGASSWKMLSNFGGSLSIEEYRKMFQKVSYVDCQQHLKVLKVLPFGPFQEIFEEVKHNSLKI